MSVSTQRNRFAGEMSCQCLHKQTDLLENCRVSVHADAITVKESHFVFIFGGKSM